MRFSGGQMIKAVFFDFDGVLTTDATGTTTIIKYIKNNTELDHTLFEKAYRKHNRDLLYGKTTHKKIWHQICVDFGENIDFNILIQSFLSTPIDTVILNLSVALKEKGYFIGIITDNKQDRIESIFSKLEYKSIFDKIIVSSEIGSGKKEKTIFHKAISKCNFNFNECIFIDNSEANLIVPRQLGVETIFFDHDDRNHEKLKTEIADIIDRKAV
jgi:putative hydrolase of the HAD superfamily